MPSRSKDALFLLVKSLNSNEKRQLKLLVKRNANTEDVNTLHIFDALDKMADYDEVLLLKKVKSVKKQQLSNTKALLYKQIMAALRSLRDDNNVQAIMQEMLTQASILFNKALYMQALKQIEKCKEIAREYHQYSYLQQALFFEKKIEGLYITRSIQNKAELLTAESNVVNSILSNVNLLSNLALQLYGLYIKSGHARNEKEITSVRLFFESNLPKTPFTKSSFYEEVYLYQCYAWYSFIRLDFLTFYRYCQKWVDLFTQYPQMMNTETTMYIKGVHNLMSAHFDLLNFEKLGAVIKSFKKFAQSKIVQDNDNNRVSAYVYLYTAVINLHFLEGDFRKGIKMVPFLEEMLVQHEKYLDRHRIMVFYYKIACLYFGSGDYGRAVDYLNRIINQKDDLRTDLQCYSRLLHLIAHFELGNYDLIEYLIKSVYRYMAKMDNLTKVEEAIFDFLKKAFQFDQHSVKKEFLKLHGQLSKLQGSKLESRAFAYLDIISWLESKIYNKNVQDIIREKYLRKRRGV